MPPLAPRVPAVPWQTRGNPCALPPGTETLACRVAWPAPAHDRPAPAELLTVPGLTVCPNLTTLNGKGLAKGSGSADQGWGRRNGVDYGSAMPRCRVHRPAGQVKRGRKMDEGLAVFFDIGDTLANAVVEGGVFPASTCTGSFPMSWPGCGPGARVLSCRWG